ncbi:amidase [Aciduricibacillus chroicocephali]|uniref:Amidase n=1 Tax=Aciduricibacillus chroicocephali TaxID=3054939 RepID=A0ABY9KWY9_9BACI|nr:amidase [Bacillaceae bacterium 44XB]
MKQSEYIQLSACELSELISSREVKAGEIADLAIGRAKEVNAELNAIVHERFSKALKETEEIGEGRFAGVPILLKNISQALAGEPLTSGSILMKDARSEADSNYTKKLKEAGFVVMGHTNTPEFGLKNITEPKLYGPSRNPWNQDFSPGGSSGGAAAAVASGIVPVAGASDGGGSIRIPASFTGLVGLKPTRGRTPVGPGVGRQWQGASIDFVLSRTVPDSAALLDELQVIEDAAAFQVPLYNGSYEEELYTGLQKPLRIGFTVQSPVGTPVASDAVEAVHKMAKWLESEGHIVEEADNHVDGYELMRNYFLMNSGEMAGVVKEMEAAFGRKLQAQDMEIESWILNIAGQSVSAAEFTASLASWDKAAAHMAKFHEKYDLYLTPSTAYPAPKVGELTHSRESEDRLLEQMEGASAAKQQEIIYDMFLPSLTVTPFTQLANLTGQPAISLPVHLTEAGLPLGVQLVAPKGREDLLLKISALAEQSDIWQGMKGNPYFN